MKTNNWLKGLIVVALIVWLPSGDLSDILLLNWFNQFTITQYLVVAIVLLLIAFIFFKDEIKLKFK